MTEGLRERKKRETRIALSWAAIRLVVDRGYSNVRIEGMSTFDRSLFDAPAVIHR